MEFEILIFSCIQEMRITQDMRIASFLCLSENVTSLLFALFRDVFPVVQRHVILIIFSSFMVQEKPSNGGI